MYNFIVPFDDNEQEIRLTERFARHARDFDDLQNEMAGRDVGRIARFLPDNANSADPSGRSKDERAETLTRLQLMLTENPAYAALFEETANILTDAQSRLDVLLERVRAQIGQSTAELEDKLDRAARLPDGTRVFKDQNGQVRTLDGAAATADLAATVLWNGDEPSYEDVQSDIARLSRLEELESDIQSGQAEIGDMQAAMDDDDNPPSEDDLESFGQRGQDIVDALEQDMAETLTKAAPATEPGQTASRPTATIIVPEL